MRYSISGIGTNLTTARHYEFTLCYAWGKDQVGAEPSWNLKQVRSIWGRPLTQYFWSPDLLHCQDLNFFANSRLKSWIFHSAGNWGAGWKYRQLAEQCWVWKNIWPENFSLQHFQMLSGRGSLGNVVQALDQQSGQLFAVKEALQLNGKDWNRDEFKMFKIWSQVYTKKFWYNVSCHRPKVIVE